MCLCPQDGLTALHLAAREGKVDVVKLLTDAQAQIDIRAKVYMHYVMECCVHVLLVAVQSCIVV